MRRVAFLFLLTVLVSLAFGSAFVPSGARGVPKSRTILFVGGSDDDGIQKEIANRRDFVGAFMGAFAAGVLIEGKTSAAEAAEQGQSATIWMSGKPPKVPGQKPKDKNDLSGTRKDPSFLRSISSCKSQCENSVGPDGFARSKEECLSDCQDICCTTYEQCSFAIVPRI